jgi:hypothetical protein
MIDLRDSIMVTEGDNSLDVTFNSGAFVRLHRCGETATFPAGTVRLHFIGSDRLRSARLRLRAPHRRPCGLH